MPIHACTLPHGGIGYKWGHEGHCYPTKAEAEKQARAILAAQAEAAKKEKQK